MASAARDNWERLVAAVVKKEQIWQLCHQNSISTIASDFSDGILSFSSISLRSVSSSRSLQLPLTNDSVIEDRKNASKTITQKLFSTLLWRRKPTEYYGLQSFSLKELIAATDNFSNKNIIGHGGHSTVYKGRLADGSLVAVKELRYRALIEGELEIAKHIKHRNIVELHGFCITREANLLVYPYMENGSVASCLRGSALQRPLWPVRKMIALGVAKGLAYLHHECLRVIIHGNVKAANILLDENFEAVVADFILAKFMGCDDDNISGTVGHIAPEYFRTFKRSEKIDVFAYGAFLLELITGRRALDLAQHANDDGMMLMDWVYNLSEKRVYEAFVDSNLQWAFVEEEVEEMLQMAIICMQKDPKGRPTMLEVVRMLEDGDGLPERWDELLMNKLASERSLSEVHGNLEWIIDDSSSIPAEELSSPR